MYFLAIVKKDTIIVKDTLIFNLDIYINFKMSKRESRIKI